MALLRPCSADPTAHAVYALASSVAPFVIMVLMLALVLPRHARIVMQASPMFHGVAPCTLLAGP
eukprot:1337863-Alexandrium_andersonii.AAC.1